MQSSMMKRIFEMVDNQDLETWRREMLEELQEMGGDLLVNAEKILGERVDSLWVTGSVLNSEKFTEKSDVDVAVRVTRPGESPSSGQSEKLAGRLYAHGSALDVSLWVNKDPEGLRVA